MDTQEPIAISSKLGWLFSGPIESSSVANLVSSHVIITENVEGNHLSSNSDQLTEMLKQFWETETLGIIQHESERCNEEGTFLQEIKFVNGHYEVELSWRRGHQIFLITSD